MATITPASGFVGPIGALILGAAAGFICFFAVDIVKQSWNVDDSLDVFAVHGVGGLIGTLLVSFLALGAFGGGGLAEGVTAARQLGVQFLGAASVAVWSAVATFVIVKIVGAIAGGMRVDEEDELVGLDLATHGERGYDL